MTEKATTGRQAGPTGGTDRDRFVFFDAFGNDTITDFDIGNDLIDLSTVSGLTDLATLMASHMQQAGDNVVVSDGLGNTIMLTDVSLANLIANNFALAVMAADGEPVL
ncbi:hypothetical protein [Leisingera sp. S232]|uniref:hypothetical protein n=1 Tax=Leisingera sp. S232 TaxID=3415132 RepID=UPI003C7D65AC